MTALGTIGCGNVGTAATDGQGPFDAHANGDLEVIGSADDNDYGEVTNNATGDYRDGYLLDAMPSDFGTMNSVSVRLRYLWSATPTNSTWPILAARIVRESDGTVLAANDSGGTYEQVASSITTTTATNSSVVGFTYVNTTANKTAWDDANLQIQMTRARTKGGGSEGQRVTAAEITGDYDIAAATAGELRGLSTIERGHQTMMSSSLGGALQE